jgi:uncharacterized protein (DUF924 family)
MDISLQANEILEFWFGKPDEVDYGKPRKVWFIKNPEFDQDVRSRFMKHYEQAATGQLDEWKASPLMGLRQKMRQKWLQTQIEKCFQLKCA